MLAPHQVEDASNAPQGKDTDIPAQERGLADNRPAALAQRRMAEMIESRTAVARHSGDVIHNGARMAAQRRKVDAMFGAAGQSERADGNLTATLKRDIERLSGYAMDDVRVHYNSSKPAQLQAHAYAQGTDIHVAPGQEHHVAHEAWHVVQQKQGRVQPTMYATAGVGVNADPRLEAEADAMALRLGAPRQGAAPVQRMSNASQLLAPQARRSVIELEYPQRDADAAPVQLLANANVVVYDQADGKGAVIRAINFAERVPTTVADGQGDHTIAEVLIQESISSLQGKTIPDFLAGLHRLVETTLGGGEKAMHTSQLGKTAQITKSGLVAAIGNLVKSVHATPATNFAYLLSELTTMYWRLLEKREMTAFERKAGFTQGGGYEKAGMGQLRRIKERLYSQKGEDGDYGIDDALQGAIGYGPFLMDVLAHAFHIDDLKTLAIRAAIHIANFLEIQDGKFIDQLVFQLMHDFGMLRNTGSRAAAASGGKEEQKASMDD